MITYLDTLLLNSDVLYVWCHFWGGFFWGEGNFLSHHPRPYRWGQVWPVWSLGWGQSLPASVSWGHWPLLRPSPSFVLDLWRQQNKKGKCIFDKHLQIGKSLYLSTKTISIGWHTGELRLQLAQDNQGCDLTKVTNPEKWVAGLGLPLV